MSNLNELFTELKLLNTSVQIASNLEHQPLSQRKPKLKIAQPLLALDETRRYRCELLKTNTTILKSVIESVPCFGEGKYVLYEFKKMLAGKFADIVENTEVLVRAIQRLMDTVLGPDALNADDDGKCEANTEVLQKSKTGTAPTLTILKGDVNCAYITRDDVTIKCYGDCNMVYIIQLLAVNYVFDIDYPRPIAMFLGFLQQFIFNLIICKAVLGYTPYVKIMSFPNLHLIIHHESFKNM
ncbi:hypothetical protein MAR_013790 [Mya arenaria]|uniref:Uncharacterized protein n=1 Tax=Mya arenaria TaxID=6604 RepID=A0ABY7G4W8_MYAAR|nr:hypothetical protein MAR_013790 [Mya arenaria]